MLQILDFITCDCNKVYIGETCRTLSVRVNEHEMNKKSSIYLHTQKCTEFTSSYLQKCTNKPVPTEAQFLIKHFEILATNLKYHDRITYEAIEIEKYDNKIKLNKQKDFVKSLVLI